MLYFLVTLLVIIIAWFFMVWIRKTMWDAVHRNLLDLEDEIDGKVQRSGFASRPFFSGKYKGYALTINFSSEKIAGKRLTYVDMSYALPSKISFSVSEKKWLEEQNAGTPGDFIEWQNSSGQTFLLRPASDKKVQGMLQKTPLKELFDEQNDLAYLFVGSTSILYEFISEEVIKTTEKDAMLKRLHIFDKLREVLK